MGSIYWYIFSKWEN